MFRSLETYSKIIIAKIHDRDNRGELGAHISLICREMLRYLASLQFSYTNKGIYNAPIDVLESVSSLAHIMYVSFSYLSGTQKEETQKYFYEWSDVTPGSFDEQLSDVIRAYGHPVFNGSRLFVHVHAHRIVATAQYVGIYRSA